MSDLVPLAAARTLVPGSPCVATLRRWASSGVRGRKLDTVLRGGRRYVSPAALEQFVHSPPLPISKQGGHDADHA
ncbi:MAG: DUF1580 domain-containing protein [Planctomycetaceae bacterium]|nr:DUF1580 domain-containing protein [Planctomycetaceae bacterium]